MCSKDFCYPYLFRPNVKTLVWGTEDWTVSAVPQSESVVDNGACAGQKLTEVIAMDPAAILGKEVALKYNNEMPILSKIIDAHQDLSIQVHPNDEMARREHDKNGKSEMWYILDAEPGAYLYAGFREHITPYEYKKRVEDGSIAEVLAKHEVRPGDVFYLPSGRVHAICGGIRLAEIQQSSDVTYRIFDYNRLGLDGRPRELHTELASQAIDYQVYPEYKTENRDERQSARVLLNTPYFSVKIVETSKPFHRNMIKYDSFMLMMALGGDCRIRIQSSREGITLAEGQSCLIPAAIADYQIIPIGASVKVLEAFINNKKTISQQMSDFFRMTLV